MGRLSTLTGFLSFYLAELEKRKTARGEVPSTFSLIFSVSIAFFTLDKLEQVPCVYKKEEICSILGPDPSRYMSVHKEKDQRVCLILFDIRLF